MQQPFFSIIIPTYNREEFVNKTVKSFLAQTFTNFEIIIVDDGGSDNSAKMAESFGDQRVHYFWKQNEERGAARNYGAALAKGAYLNFFDSDDIAYQSHLQISYNIVKNNRPELVFLGFEFVNQHGDALSAVNNFNGDIVKDIINRNKRNLNSVFIRRDVFNEIKFEENRLLAASEDTLLLCRLVARHKPVFSNVITSAMVEHSGRSMVTASEEQLLNRRKYLLKGLQADDSFMAKYAANLVNISAEMAYLLCLNCLATQKNAKAFRYFKESLKGAATLLLSRRTLVFLKKWLLNLF
jgi:glycosyltransferase involved in cell wall biosynthesis